MIKVLFLPSHIVVELFLLAVMLNFIATKRNWSRVALLASAATYVAFSSGVVAAALMGPLEYKYPYLDTVDEYGGVTKIVLLTAYATDDQLWPLSSRASSEATYRVLEAFRIYKERAGMQIVVSGDPSSAKVMKDLLHSLGVPEESVLEYSGAVHTSDSAASMVQYVGDEFFFLVTSSGHMPRAMGSFRHQGLNPIPAPTDYHLPKNFRNATLDLSPYHLLVSDLAVREYGGILWYSLTGRFSN